MSRKNFSLSHYYETLLPLTRFSVKFYTEHQFLKDTLSNELGIHYAVSSKDCEAGDIRITFEDERMDVLGKVLLSDGKIKNMEIVTRGTQLDLLEFSKEEDLVNVYVHSILNEISEHQYELKRQKEDIVTEHLQKIRKFLKGESNE